MGGTQMINAAGLIRVVYMNRFYGYVCIFIPALSINQPLVANIDYWCINIEKSPTRRDLVKPLGSYQNISEHINYTSCVPLSHGLLASILKYDWSTRWPTDVDILLYWARYFVLECYCKHYLVVYLIITEVHININCQFGVSLLALCECSHPMMEQFIMKDMYHIHIG